MTDQEIDAAGEALKKLLQQNRDTEYGRIEGEIKKGRVDELTLYPERAGIRGGKIVISLHQG